MTNEPAITAQKKAWSYLRFGIAALLVVAAGAKILNVGQILSGDGLLSSRSLLLAVIAFEAAVATYLLIGNTVRSWWLTLATFSAFAVSAGYAIATGQDCNCIADGIGPQFMLPLDLTVLALTMWCRPKADPVPQNGNEMEKVVSCVVVAALFVCAAGFRELDVDRDDPLEFLIADTMIHKPWPLNSRLQPELKPLETGRWLVLVIRRDCTHCRELLSNYFSDPGTHRKGERTAVFVTGGVDWPFQLDHVSLDINGNTQVHWATGEPFVASPAVFLVQDGVVDNASDGNASDAFVRQLFAD